MPARPREGLTELLLALAIAALALAGAAALFGEEIHGSFSSRPASGAPR